MRSRGESGQTTVEYVLIVLFVALVLVFALASAGLDVQVAKRSADIAGIITNAIAH